MDSGTATGATNGEAPSASSTVFNGLEVPPMKELNGKDFDTETKDGYWYAVEPTLSYHHSSAGGTNQVMLLISVPQVCEALLAILSPLHSHSTNLADTL